MATRSYNCLVDGCHSKALARGWCNKHYLRWKKHGDVNVLKQRKTPKGVALAFLFQSLEADTDECIFWEFARKSMGQGCVWFEGSLRVASNIVCELAHGAAPGKDMHAAHSCGRGHMGCINKRHLSWKTPTENAADRLVHGTDNRGVKHGMAKLTPRLVREIRALKGKLSIRKIGGKFGVSHGCIFDIHAGRTWSHLP